MTKFKLETQKNVKVIYSTQKLKYDYGDDNSHENDDDALPMMIMVERVGLRIKGKHDRSSTKINKIQTSKSLNHTLGKGEKRK